MMMALKCMKCGHKWVPRVPKPLKCPICAQPKYWEPRVWGPAEAVKVVEAYEGPRPEPPRDRTVGFGGEEPELNETGENMDELRRIAAGDPKALRRANSFMPDDEPETEEPEMCPFYEDIPETAERVWCALHRHGPKVKHQPGRREGL